MSEDVLSGAGAEAALQRLLRRGMQGRFSGLDAIRSRLRQQRRREQQQLDLEGPLEEIRERLGGIVERERTTLSFEVEDDARMREQFLQSLPEEMAGKLKELGDYRFVDKRAQREFDELMDFLKQQVLGSYFRNLSEGMKNMSPEDLQRFRDMLAELNQMLEARDRGEPVDFDGFMQRYGDFFPENPRNLDELLEGLGRRMAAMSRLLASLSPDQRAELQALADQVMQDLDLQFEADRLMNNLAGMFPEMPWDDPALAGGEDVQPLQATVDALERLSDYEDLERAMRGDYAGADLADVDEDALRRTLGDDAVRDLRKLKEVERALEQAGLMQRNKGRLEVTPRGARKLGERALVKVFEHLRRDREGVHVSRHLGGASEPTGSTRPWHFGDVGQIAVQRTVFNAVVRDGPSPTPKLEPADFELIDAETRTA